MDDLIGLCQVSVMALWSVKVKAWMFLLFLVYTGREFRYQPQTGLLFINLTNARMEKSIGKL